MKLFELLADKFNKEQSDYILNEIKNSEELFSYAKEAPNYWRLGVMIEKVKARFSNYNTIKTINFSTIDWEYIYNKL